MVRFRPFQKKLLSDLAEEDLHQLVRDEVAEGLFLEYKRDWSPEKLARAVASFANSPAGGTVIVGIEAEGLLPKHVLGVDVQGELAASAVQAIRSHVDPIPDFRPVEVELSTGRRCLVVEIPEGTDPPYMLVRSGVVLERTPTSSDPVVARSRDTLDRLYSRGERGRAWAAGQGSAWLQQTRQFTDWLSFRTIPAVHGGIDSHAVIFRESFIGRLGLSSPVPFEHSDYSISAEMSGDHVSVRHRLVYETRTSVFTSGVIDTTWAHRLDTSGRRQDMTFNDLDLLLNACTRRHPEMLTELLGHRGRVTVCLTGAIFVINSGAQLVDFQRDALALSEVAGSIAGMTTRHVRRQLGFPTYEPEEDRR